MTARACMARVALAGVLLWPAVGIRAETVIVRSGEHDGFSRVVIAPAEKTGWVLGRVGQGYELRLSRAGILFDLSRAFDLIPRHRLSAISPGTQDSSLSFGLGCACHAAGFETAGGAIVVDLISGAAQADSIFEKPLDLLGASPLLTGAAKGPAATAAVWPWPAAGADPDLSHYWASHGTDRADARAVDPPAVAGRARTARLPAAPGRSEDISGVGHRQFLPPADPPDIRIAEAKAALLVQLSRAAAQGLVIARKSGGAIAGASHRTAGSATAPTAGPDQSRAAAGAGRPAVAPAPPETGPAADPSQGLAIRAETSVDRDGLITVPAAPATPGRLNCSRDADVAVPDWTDGTDPADQLVRARQGLLGEFDRADTDKIVRLARLQISLGFGAEARALLDAFAVDEARAPLLRDLAALVDGEPPGAASVLYRQAGCASPAALWAVLAAGRLAGEGTQDTGALLRAFSVLPPQVRRAVGSRLADIFLAAGADDAARSVRDAMERAPGAAPGGIGLLDARLRVAQGDAQSAETILDGLAKGNDAAAPEALILLIETRAARNERVEPSLAEAAEALAAENRHTLLGSRLSRAYALALAASGRYADAFAVADALSHSVPDHAPTLRRDLFRHMAENAADADFLTQMALGLGDFGGSGADIALRLRVADRLASGGLPDLAAKALGAEAGGTGAGREILARAALADFRPADALRALEGIASPAADGLRGQALARQGDQLSAADAYAAAGMEDARAEAAWRGADWQHGVTAGDKARQTALAALGVTPPSPVADGPRTGKEKPVAAPGAAGPPAAMGPIGKGKALVESTRSLRSALDALLAHPVPAGG